MYTILDTDSANEVAAAQSINSALDLYMWAYEDITLYLPVEIPCRLQLTVCSFS
jgi:hypothetical protein